MQFEIPYPELDPILFSIGPASVRWYGVLFVVGFVIAWLLGRYRARKPGSGWTSDDVIDLILYAAVGLLVGGRVGYVLFYGMDNLLADPLYLFKITEGGNSFHGGLVGVLVALWIFGRAKGRNFWDVTDFLVPLVPLGLFFGRIGNFINGELWGAPTDLPWGIVFPSGGPEPRHPSMLYEAILEGLVLFAILWIYSARKPPRMAASGVFLLGYGVFRTLVEFVREPDAHIGYLAGGWLTMGMLLSAPMIVAGVVLIVLAYRDPRWPEVGGAAAGAGASPSSAATPQDAEAGTSPSSAATPQVTSPRPEAASSGPAADTKPAGPALADG